MCSSILDTKLIKIVIDLLGTLLGTSWIYKDLQDLGDKQKELHLCLIITTPSLYWCYNG